MLCQIGQFTLTEKGIKKTSKCMNKETVEVNIMHMRTMYVVVALHSLHIKLKVVLLCSSIASVDRSAHNIHNI